MRTRRLYLLISLLLAVLTLTLLGPAHSPPATGNSSPTAGHSERVQGNGKWVVRAYYSDRQMVNELAAWLEPWEVRHAAGYLLVGVDSAQYDRLAQAGFQLQIDWQLTNELNRTRTVLPGQESGIPGFPCYRTIEETYATAQAVADAHPHLVTWLDIGDSWDKTETGGPPGYDLKVLRLTNSNLVAAKPKLFVVASIHGREYATAELLTRFAEYLVEGYNHDADATWLLDHHEFHLLLVANPDGRFKAEEGLLWRKNTNQDYCAPAPNDRGADLNRNFTFQWGCCGGASGAECDELYRGPAPSSEPETRAIENYVRGLFPDQRGDNLTDPAPADATGLFLDLHSHGQLILWPWGFTSDPAPNSSALQTLGRKLALTNHYWPQQSHSLYPADGTTGSFAYGELGLAAYTIELGTWFFQDCSSFEQSIVPENLPALIYAAKVARAPYQTPAGPDLLDLSLSTMQGPAGKSFHLTATADDTRYSQANGQEPAQPIAAAEFYVDVPPWSTSAAPVAHPMAATDGAFDQETEFVEALLEASSLDVGRHILFVRGQDADGNWGAFTATFLDVHSTGYTVLYLPITLRTP